MKIALIGAGNLATNLGKAVKKAGHEVLEVFSRTEESASTLASTLGCPFTTDLQMLTSDADIYIISVKDSVLEPVAMDAVKGREGKLFVHTAGSMPLTSIPNERRGVFYPMQTFSKQKEVDFSIIPCFVEAAMEEDRDLLVQLGKSISNTVCELSTDDRKYLHLSAVFCCNFVNHCYALSEKILKEHGGVPFDVMLPLVEETFNKVKTHSPRTVQTGPAVRWDENVIRKQEALLAKDETMQAIYKLLSKSIHDDQL